MKKIYYLLITSLLLPNDAFAQGQAGNDVSSLLVFLRHLFTRNLIPLFVLLALVYFIYAVIGFIGANENESRRSEKKQQILYSVIALFIILTVWGLVNVVGNTFNIFRGTQLRPQ